MARWEWEQQKKLSALLTRWLPDDAFFSAVDNVARDALSGAMRRKRGVVPGLPDTLIWHCGRTIAVELKSPVGKCSPAQKAVRLKLIAAGCAWWEARTAAAAMVAIAASGVSFRAIVHEDGSVERWRQSELADWEVPRTDPCEKRPAHPKVKAARRVWSARRRAAREAARLAAEQHQAGNAGADVPGAHDAQRVNDVPVSIQRRGTIGGPLRARLPSREAVMAAADRAEARAKLNKSNLAADSE